MGGSAMLLPRLLLGAMASVGAAGDGAEHTMMAGIVTGHAAHHRALQTALGVGRRRRQRQSSDGEQYG